MTKRKKPCGHFALVLIGSEETGTKEVRCKDCQAPFTRHVLNGEYVYEPLDESDARSR
jgi:hypothetical protein